MARNRLGGLRAERLATKGAQGAEVNAASLVGIREIEKG